MANLEEMNKLWESAYLQESAQLCVLHNYYIQIYINLCLVISPSRAPQSQIYLWHTFRRPVNALAFLVTRLYVAFTICIQDQTCNLYEYQEKFEK